MGSKLHPDTNIAKLFNHFTNEDTNQFIQERGGLTLYDQLRNKRGVDIATKLHILKDIASGLKAMHAVNIGHCDLKIENVLNFEENDFKIIDMESSIDFNGDLDEEVNIKSSLSIMPPELQV